MKHPLLVVLLISSTYVGDALISPNFLHPRPPSASYPRPPSVSWAQFENLRQEPVDDVTDNAEEVWDESTKLAVEAEIAVATAWLLLLTGVPVLLRCLDGRKRTNTQAAIGVLFIAAVIGGMLLFTNIVKFNSGHFKQTRTLTIVECIYLMSQVITTVGYGDITPAYPRGQVFVGLYVLMSLFIIALLVSELTEHVMLAAKAYKEKLVGAQRRAEEGGEVSAKRRSEAAHAIIHKVAAPSNEPLIGSFLAFSFFAVTWILFFHYYPGEGKTWLQAIYMSVITLSTVGFGAFTPSTEGGKVFASFWMIFGSAALVNVITQFSELMLKLQEYERYDPSVVKQALETYQQENSEMSELEFLKFGLMQKGIVSEGELKEMQNAFNRLASGDGVQKRVSVELLRNELEDTSV